MENKVSITETNTEEHVPTPSNDPLPSGEDRMQLKELMELCINLSNKVHDLENEVIEMKSSHKVKIEELKSSVEKLEEKNMSLTKELKSFNARVKSPTIKEIVMDKEELSKQGRKIVDIDADAEFNMENMYNLDMAHEEIVLSMQDVPDANVKEVVEEVVELIEIAKSIVDEVSTAGGKLNAANEKPVQSRQLDAVRKYQALKRKHVSVAQARKNMMIYLKNMDGYKMDYFKGISYDQIRPIFEMEYNKVQAYLNKGPKIDVERIKAPRKRTRKEKVEKDQPAKRQKGVELEQDNAK
nr:hypothetical protein [Tanacetum cinerariifolium]